MPLHIPLDHRSGVGSDRHVLSGLIFLVLQSGQSVGRTTAAGLDSPPFASHFDGDIPGDEEAW